MSSQTTQGEAKLEDAVSESTLFEKIRTLPPDKIAEVEEFVDFLRQRDEEKRLTLAASKLSEPVFQKVWDNPEDAEYDQL